MKNKSKNETKNKPKSKNFLETLERISVIFAAILGAIAFFWQVSGYISSKQERVNIILWCHIRPYTDTTPQLSIEIINTSDRAIYIKSLQFWAVDSSVSGSAPVGLVPFISPEIGTVYPNLDLIDIGASREYDIKIDTAQLMRFSEIYLAVNSATSEIRRTEDLTPPLQYFSKRLKEAEQAGNSQSMYQCNQ